MADITLERDQYLDDFYMWLCDNTASDENDLVSEKTNDLNLIVQMTKMHDFTTDEIALAIMYDRLSVRSK